MRIRKGMKVRVIRGNHKGSEGKILFVFLEDLPFYTLDMWYTCLLVSQYHQIQCTLSVISYG